jgi:hypothetical protein
MLKSKTIDYNRTLDTLNKEEYLLDLSKSVFEKEALDGWRIEVGAPPSECIEDLRLIRISENYLNDGWYYLKEIFLHEVAHVGNYIADNHGHTPEFFRKLGELHIKYCDL